MQPSDRRHAVTSATSGNTTRWIIFYFQSDRLKEFNSQLFDNYVIEKCKIGNLTTFSTKMY
ncbi:unnamed protein product, partial [Callosobruchus maculatus]